MSSIHKNRRKRKRAVKRLDMTNMVKTLEDFGFARGFFSCVAIVLAADDGGQHFDLDGKDMTVEVSLMPSETQITARVGTVAGGFGAGIWLPPPVGAEVLVAVPDGKLEFQPVIQSWYSSGQLPADISATVMVISAPAGGEIYMHDGSGPVEPLVRKSEFDALKSYIDAHRHDAPQASAGSLPTSIPSSSAAGALIGGADAAPTASGTAVVKAK